MKSWGSIFAASLGVLFGLIVATAYAQSEEEGESLTEPKPASPSEMEELLVTGTYIQGLTQENLASPLQTISRSEMLDLGAFRLEDIVNNLTINTGSENNPDAFTQNFTSGTSNINLRGLGVASTLVLLNGRRQTYSGFTTDKGENFVDTSSLVPMIAVERVEILKDGAASLYGSDAVAGVVNFITRDNFEGAEVMLESQTGEDQGDLKLGGIYGTGNESTHFIVAFEYLDRDGLGTDERRLSTVEDDTSRAGFPGTFLFPTSPGAPYDDDWNTAYNSNGANGGIADFFEPLLGFPVVPGAEQPAFADPDCTEIAASDDTTVPPDTFPLGPCQFDFGTFFSLVPDEERAQFYTNLNHDINDSLKLFLEAALADNSAQRRNSPSFPITTTPVVCGNGALNGFNLDGTAYTCVGGANPVPAHPNNPFGADALFVGRVQGSGGDSLISYHDSRTTRLAAGLSGDSFNAFDEDWGWNVDLTRSRNEFILTAEDTLAEEFQLALLGLGGENCSGLAADAGDADAGCFYFNPFGTSLIPGSGGRANPAEVYDYITGTIRIDTQAELRTLSAVATSNPFVMEGGNSGLAVGVQLRNESLDYDYDENSNRENFIFFTGNPDFDGERDIKAAFTELALPVKDNMDVQLSLRYEDYEDSGNSTDPKIAVLYRPADNLSLRSSFSTSFRAPSLFQQSGVQTTLVEISTDTLGNQFIPVRSEPNPDDPLKPEEANVINLGASWISSSAAFKLNADYWSYDYENVIIQQNPQGIVNQAQEDGNPCNDPQITCSAGTISRVLVYYDNASELQTDGLDLSGGYSWAIDSGNYAVGLELTKILSYDLKDPQAGSIDGLGQRNFTNFANSVPELRANLHLAWSLDRHAVNAFSRFIDSYNNDQLYDGQPRNETIDAQTTLDIQYSYRFQAFGWADDDMTISVGGINITDEDPPHVATNGGYDSKVHDPRGALYYLKLNMPL